MTVFVETDFLFAIAKDDDWLQNRAEEVLNDHEVVTSPFAYLELLIILESHQFNYVRLFANLLDIVPVGNEEEQQLVLKAVAYFEGGMTPFDSFHAATAETRGLSIVSSGKTYRDVDGERLPLEPETDE
jgi:predicted nucleic acid-binding protein